MLDFIEVGEVSGLFFLFGFSWFWLRPFWFWFGQAQGFPDGLDACCKSGCILFDTDFDYLAPPVDMGLDLIGGL